MKNANVLMIRYLGMASETERFHVIQRATGEFWTGEGWSKILDCAKLFRRHRDAQRECAAIQYRRWRGKPQRTYKIEVHVTLVADEIGAISHEEVRQFLSDAVRLDVETSIFGSGPGENSYLQARMILATLKETESSRKRF